MFSVLFRILQYNSIIQHNTLYYSNTTCPEILFLSKNTKYGAKSPTILRKFTENIEILNKRISTVVNPAPPSTF